MLIFIHILGFRLRNFEIRVGNDEDLVNNGICYKQMESVGDGLTEIFPCHETIYGSWVNVNKSYTGEENSEHLQLREVRVFASEYKK